MRDAPDIAIRDLRSVDDYLACVALQDETWGTEFTERVPPAILRVAQRIGGVAAGAFTADGTMAGFVFGMTGVRDGRLVHWSDMLAVQAGLRDLAIGQRLKLYQRERVRALGVEIMMWTFDPLVARNAHFNINVLGARPAEYVEDMYGSRTGSELHGALPTDRLIAHWDLTRDSDAERTGAPSETRSDADADSTHIALANPVMEGDLPQVDRRALTGGGSLRVQVPRDLPELQRRRDGSALRWRMAVRDALVGLLDAGYEVVAFVRGSAASLPYYVLHPRGAQPS